LRPCPFCSVARERILIETEHAIAFPDSFPVTEAHALIVPRRHVASVYDLSTAEQIAIWELVGRVRNHLLATTAPDGFNIGINDGLGAGQTVMHAHVPVIP
jgi:diadenosine tetraphosphate (Ap4A) HIT family hydrolase